MKRAILVMAMLVFYSFFLTKAGGTVIFDDGKIHNINRDVMDSVQVWDSSSSNITIVNILSGAKMFDLDAYDRSIITVSGGSIDQNLHTEDSSQLTFSGGTIDNYLAACDYSNVNFSSGIIGTNLVAIHYSSVIFSGGTIGDKIYAGNDVQNSSVITFYGSDFAINGVPVGYGEFDTGGADWVSGTLTGTLANNDHLNNQFYIYGDSHIVLTPEPATIFLLGLGTVMLRRRIDLLTR